MKLDMQQFVISQPDGNIGIRSRLMQGKDSKKIFIEKVVK